jgi:phosphocarrier protein
MIQTRITIINKYGLHARAAAKFVSTASGFSSAIKMGRNGQMIDGKSIMSVMMLAAAKGSELELMIEGNDEQRALDALTRLINDYFGEGE